MTEVLIRSAQKKAPFGKLIRLCASDGFPNAARNQFAPPTSEFCHAFLPVAPIASQRLALC